MVRSTRPDIFGAIKAREMPTHNLFSCVACNAVGSGVPGRDESLGIQHVDGMMLNGSDEPPGNFIISLQLFYARLASRELPFQVR
jgi:hypothetical protein